MEERTRSVAWMRMAAATTLAFLLSGCATYVAPVKPPGALLFTMLKAPLTVDFHATPAGKAVTKHAVKRTFYVCSHQIQNWSAALGNAAIGEIAREGGIKEISFADYELLNILNAFAIFTVHVYGN